MRLFFKIEQPLLNGNDIKALRESQGISQEVLAKRTGVARGTIGRIESTGEEIKKVSDYVALQEYFKTEQVKEVSPQKLTIAADSGSHEYVATGRGNINGKMKEYIALKAKAEKLFQEILEDQRKANQ